MTERGVDIVFVKENLIFTGEDSPMSNLLLSVMGAFVQFERELIRERQHDAMRSRCGKGSTPAGSRVRPPRGRPNCDGELPMVTRRLRLLMFRSKKAGLEVYKINCMQGIGGGKR